MFKYDHFRHLLGTVNDGIEMYLPHGIFGGCLGAHNGCIDLTTFLLSNHCKSIASDVMIDFLE